MGPMIDAVRDYFAADRFAMGLGIQIESAGDGRAVCAVTLADSHKNAMGVAQGGLVYTLADFAFAVAAHTARPGTVTLDSTMHYLRPATCARLTATAAPVNAGRTVCLYSVAVTDEKGALVAQASFTGFCKG